MKTLILASLLNLSSLQAAEPNAHLQQQIQNYNDALEQEMRRAPLDKLKDLPEAPSLCRVALEMLNTYNHEIEQTQFSPKKSARLLPLFKEEHANFNAYAQKQVELLEKLARGNYASAQGQSYIESSVLSQQKWFASTYPQAEQKLTSLISLAQGIYQKEQARPDSERKANYAAKLKRIEAQNKEPRLIGFHQLSPAMQDFQLRYFCALLAADVKILEQNTKLDDEGYSLPSIKAELHILRTLDASKLSEKQQQELKSFTTLLANLSDSLEKPQQAEQLEKNSQQLMGFLSQHGGNGSVFHEPLALHMLLNHYDLAGYMQFLCTPAEPQKLAKAYPLIIHALKRKAGLISPEVQTYNEQFLRFDSEGEFKNLRTPPTKGLIAYQLNMCYRLRKNEPYAEAQHALLKALANARYDSPQAQSQLWQNTLTAQAKLETRYPQAAEKLTNLVALVQSIWLQEQNRSATERAQNYRANENLQNALANKWGETRFNQWSAAEQEYNLQYLYAILESEAQMCEQSESLDESVLLLSSMQSELRILSSLDASQLPEGYRQEIKHYCLKLAEIIQKVKNTQGYEAQMEIVDDFATHYGETQHLTPINQRSVVLNEVLEHFELRDYYFYLWQQLEGKKGYKHLPSINRPIIKKIQQKAQNQ